MYFFILPLQPYVENDGPVPLFGNVSITDPDGPTLHSAYVTIHGLSCTSLEEYLLVSTSGTELTVSRDGPCLQVTGYDTLDNYSKVLMTLRWALCNVCV